MSTEAKASRVPTVLALTAVMIAVIAAPTASAAAPSGKRIERTVRALMERYPLRSTLFGVWARTQAGERRARRVAAGRSGDYARSLSDRQRHGVAYDDAAVAAGRPGAGAA